MEKLRKIIALLVGMMMTVSLMPQTVLGTEFDGMPEYTTALDDYFAGWEKADDLTQNGNTVFSCVTNKIAHSGNNSVVLRHEDESQYGKDLKIKQVVNLGEGTYTVSFWTAGTVADHDDDPWRWQQMVWLWGSSGDGWFYVSNMNIGETDGDWTKYTMNFTVPSGGTVGELGISSRGWARGWYLDDISIVAQGDDTNLLTNGGFEGTESGEESELPTTPTYTTTLDSCFTGWEKADDLTQNGSTVFSCVTNEAAHSGNNSVVLRHEDESQYGKDLKIKQVVNLGEGTYTVSFWTAGTVADHDDDPWRWQQMVWLWGSSGDGWFYVSNMNIGETDGDWTKYTMNFTVPSGGTVGELGISSRGWARGWYLDDISIVAQGDDTNLLTNGGFEGTESGGGPEVPEGPTYTEAYEEYFQGWARNGGVTSNTTSVFACVTNEIAHSGNNSVVLKHTDSTQSGYMQIQQTSLSISEGTYTLSFWVAGEVNGQQVIWIKPGTTTANGDWLLINSAATGETEGDWTKYSTTFNVASGNTVTELTIGTNGNTNGLYLDDISIVAQGDDTNLLTNGGFEGTESGGGPEVPEGPTYTEAYEEYFQGWARNGGVTSNTTSVFACVTNEIAHSGNNSVVLKHTDSTQSGYMQIQQTSLSISEGTYTLSFWVAGEVNGQQVIWIKPGTTTANGDWLLINSAATGETEGDWTKYSTTFNVASGNTVTELTIGTNGNTNGLYLDDISIVAQGDDTNLLTNGGFEERNSDVPVGDVVKEVVLKKNGQRMDNLSGQGNYNVTLVVDNYAVENKLDVEQFVAIYDEDGVLYDKVYSTDATIEKATANGAFSKIETSFVLPEGNFTVEYFVFDGRDTLNIVGTPNPHKIFE